MNGDSSCDSRSRYCREYCMVWRNAYPSFLPNHTSDLNMSFYYVPKPPKEHFCLLPARCFTPRPPDVYYQPPRQEWVYQPPLQRYVHQPPPEIYDYQPPAQRCVYQPPTGRFVYRLGEARTFWELGIPGRGCGLPILF